jgi:DNA-binding MarR family transcriptional regulator
LTNKNESVGDFRMPQMIAAETGKVLPEQEAYLYLIRAAELVSEPIVGLFAANGVSGKQYNVLRSIRRAGNGGATVNEIRQQMTDPRADVTRLIDRLVRDRLVKRRTDKSDRRIVRVFLSDEGNRVLARIDEPLLDIHRAQFARFSPENIEQLKELLKEITSIGTAEISDE